MAFKFGIFLFSIINILSSVCLAQNSFEAKVEAIIFADFTLEKRQDQLDSFFIANSESMTRKELADYYHYIGLKWYFQIGQKVDGKFMSDAIASFEKSADIKRTLDPFDDFSLQRTLYNLGRAKSMNNDFFGAIKVYLEIVGMRKVNSKTISARRELGKSYAIIGDFHKALEHYEQLQILTGNDSQYLKENINTYIKIARTYALMGYEEYADQIRINIEKAKSLLISLNADKQDLIDEILILEGNWYLKTKSYDKALVLFNKFQENRPLYDSGNQAIVWNSIGLTQLNTGNYPEAVLSLKKSIAFESNFFPPYENLGQLYVEKKEYDKGISFYQKAIEISLGTETKEISELTGLMLGLSTEKYYLLACLISLGNTYVQLYSSEENTAHLEKAITAFKKADHLVDIIRYESNEYKSKLYWREKSASLYLKAVEVCFLMKNTQLAYYFLEKNKAVLLLEDITNEEAKESAQLPEILAKREFDFKKKIDLFENFAMNETSKDSLEKIKEQIFRAKLNYEKFLDSLTIAFPKYAELKRKIEIMPFNVFSQNYITDTTAVLHYILNDNKGFGLFNSNKGTHFFEIEDPVLLQQNLSEVFKQIKIPFTTQGQREQYRHPSYKIFNTLIPESVHQRIAGKELTIIPDYNLQQLSFDALNTSKDSLHYLIEDVEIRYAYSMTSMAKNNQQARNPQKELIGFAPVVFENESLNDLSLSEEEVNAIQEIYNGDLLLSERATKKNLMKEIDQYRIIHLSTHAGISLNASPWIADIEKKLTVNEIYTLQNQSEMVVLSACETSLGELKAGEGVMSLARAFIFSGTNSVVSSLWTTNDRASKEIMVSFYEGLSKGMTKSAALRKAKIQYYNANRGSESSPYYWASFVLIGDNAAIPPLNKQNLTSLFVIGFVILLIILLFFFLIRKRK